MSPPDKPGPRRLILVISVFALALTLVITTVLLASSRVKSPAAVAKPSSQLVAQDGLPAVRVSPQRGNTMVISFFGDSITNGSGASAEARTFRAIVVDTLGERWPVRASVMTKGDGTAATIGASSSVDAATGLSIVEVGMNDGNPQINTSPEKFTTDYQELLTKIRTTAPGSAIVCVGTWRLQASAYDAIIQNLCEANAGAYRAVSDIAKDPLNRGPRGRRVVGSLDPVGDDFSPNDRGHQAIADRVLSAVVV